MTVKVDRSKVLKFFTWTNRELIPLLVAIGCMIVASWITYLGVAIATRNAENDWVLLITSTISAVFLVIAGLLVRKALSGEKLLLEFHDEVKKAKDFDFANVLIRSFRKSGTALNNLLDFDRSSAVAACPKP